MSDAVYAYKTKTGDGSTGSRPRWEAVADAVVVGSGAAGLTAAMRMRRLGLRVLVVTKQAIADGNTRWAQGGIAAVLDDGAPGDLGDSVAAHAADTESAGAGLCDPVAVADVVRGGAAAVAELRGSGAEFDVVGAGPARTREGGHSAMRVIHAGGDATGAEVQRALVAAATDAALPVLEGHTALDAVRTPSGRIAGVTVLDDGGIPGVVRAPAVLLATGGVGQLYGATSNPELATGDGLALALRAGAPVSDVEFVQFHPTVLFTPGARGRCPLVTEAVRGEGAVLVDAAGTRVMAGEHPMEDLAPRDVVSAAITRRLASAPGGVDDHVFLDATGVDGFAGRFPTVHAACRAVGVDPAREPIPVAPAAHFACGGVVAGTDGRTPVRGLYAAGEVARTGLHGANRLASNSLLEGLVVGRRAAEAIAADLATGALTARASLGSAGGAAGGAAGDTVRVPDGPRARRDDLQRVLSRYAGIGRDAEGLAVAGSVLELSVASTSDRTDDHDGVGPSGGVDHHDGVDGAGGYAQDAGTSPRRRVEDAALTLVARALLAAATARTESRGCHVRSDFPARDDAVWARSQTIRLSPSGQPVVVRGLRSSAVAA